MPGLTLLLLSLMARPAASQAIRAASVWIAGHVGPKTLKMYHTVNTNYIGWSMHALTMAQGGPAREAPSSGLKLSSLTGPWIWDIVGLRKKKNALMRSSMRAAQGPWERPIKSSSTWSELEPMDPGHYFSLQAFEPTHAFCQATS